MNGIRNKMKIKLDKIKDDWYRADFIELCGFPYIGDGKTEAMAVASLFLRNIDNIKRLKYLDKNSKLSEDSYLEINGEPYEYPYPVDR